MCSTPAPASACCARSRSEIQAATDPLTASSFALAMCELDGFKFLNDTHGNEAGDRALRLFAATLKSCLRTTDPAARYGGEEFLLVFPDCGADAATAAVERLREELAPAVSHGNTPAFTASFGVADLSHGSTLEEMLKRADEALLATERAGKNRVPIAGSR